MRSLNPLAIGFSHQNVKVGKSWVCRIGTWFESGKAENEIFDVVSVGWGEAYKRISLHFRKILNAHLRVVIKNT